MKKNISLGDKQITLCVETTLRTRKEHVTYKFSDTHAKMLAQENCPNGKKIGKCIKSSYVNNTKKENLCGEWVFELVDKNKTAAKVIAKKEKKTTAVVETVTNLKKADLQTKVATENKTKPKRTSRSSRTKKS